MGEIVLKIRRTQNEDLLLKLSETGENSAVFRRIIGEAVGVKVEVITLEEAFGTQ